MSPSCFVHGDFGPLARCPDCAAEDEARRFPPPEDELDRARFLLSHLADAAEEIRGFYGIEDEPQYDDAHDDLASAARDARAFFASDVEDSARDEKAAVAAPRKAGGGAP